MPVRLVKEVLPCGITWLTILGLVLLVGMEVSSAACLIEPDEDGAAVIELWRTSVPANAFKGCTALRSITLHNGINSVGMEAFRDCTALEEIVGGFPSSLEIISTSAFRNLPRLREVKFPEDSQLKKLGTYAFLGAASITTLKLPSSLETWHGGTFQGCKALKLVDLSLTSLRTADTGFRYCTELETVYWNNDTTIIGWEAFKDCRKLGKINLPTNLEKVESSAFQGIALTSVKIPSFVTTIDSLAFSDNSQLEKIIMESKSISFAGDSGPFFGSPVSTVIFPSDASDLPSTLPGVHYNETAERYTCRERYQTTIDAGKGMTTCQPCPRGSLYIGSGQCQLCHPGTYSGMSGSESCTLCDPGRYADGEGNTQCFKCPLGTSNGDHGQTSSSCLSCENGKFGNITGAQSCEQCAADTFTASSGSTLCKACADGTGSEEGSSSCPLTRPWPSSVPTGEPSVQPTSQPTTIPTTFPTVDKTSFQQWSGGTRLSAKDITDGIGIFYVSAHQFTNAGRFYERYYLTISVFDTGFGPVTEGEYVQFTVNGRDITVHDETEEVLMCAPVVHSKHGNHSNGCSGKFYPCAFNVDITEHINSAKGGSVEIAVKSHGVLSSACPYEDGSIIYVKYVVSSTAQETPFPTQLPTASPTEDNLNVYNGLQLDINKLDVWTLFQIAAAVGLAMGIAGAFLTNIRKKGDAEKTVYQHPLAYTAVSLGLLGMEMTSMVFLVVKLVQYSFTNNALVVCLFRLSQLLSGGLIVLFLFGPVSAKEYGSLIDLVDADHLAAESKVYLGVAILCMVDCTAVAYLPWRDSRFAMLSKGFPCLWVYHLVSTISMTFVVVSFSCQAQFLHSQPSFDAERDLMSVLNLTLLSIKTAFILMEFYYKSSVLADESTTTARDETGKEKEKEKEKEKGSAPEGKGVEHGLELQFMEQNPMHAAKDEHEKKQEIRPLLEQHKAETREKFAEVKYLLRSLEARLPASPDVADDV